VLGQIISAKLVAAIVAGAAVASSGAAAVASTVSDSHSVALQATGETSRQNGPSDKDGKGRGQGDKISALARSTPGGKGKGAIISAAAKGHGKTVSAAASKNGKAHAAQGKANANGKSKDKGDKD
jgi:hypothetical protein